MTVAVYVETDGKPSKLNVATSSGFDDLDQAALTAVKDWFFVPGVSDNGTAEPGWTKIMIHFQETNAASGAPGIYASNDDPSNVICKRGVGATGSLLQPPPVCHTKREWDLITAADQRYLERTIDRGNNSTLP